MEEKRLERIVTKRISSIRGISLKFTSQFETGYPDRIILTPGGKTYWAEIKTTGKHPTPKQLERHEQLRRMGYQVFVIDSIEALECCMKIIENERI